MLYGVVRGLERGGRGGTLVNESPFRCGTVILIKPLFFYKFMWNTVAFFKME